MLIALMGNLGMLGGVIPPTPPQTFPGGAGKSVSDERADFEKRIQQEDEEIILLMINLLKWR